MTRFDLYTPCTQLQPYVQHFAISVATSAATYKVLPGTGIVIGFQFKGNLYRLQDNAPHLLDTAGLSGLHDRYLTFSNEPGTGTVLVYFRDAGITSFFRQPMHELFDASVSLEHFMRRSELLILEEQLRTAADDVTRVRIVETFLISRLKPADQDPLVQAALDLIWRSNGNIRIHDLILQLHSSKSPLEKRFRSRVGTSLKKFAALVRFQYILNNRRAQDNMTSLSYDAGFYDQAHFIKMFRGFTGETPEAFFKSKNAQGLK